MDSYLGVLESVPDLNVPDFIPDKVIGEYY